jgi:hypothetical protein
MTAILSELEIIEAIADRKSLEIFCSIAGGVFEGEKLKQTLALSNKQYYSRTERMLKIGLIKRKRGRFSLTGLGIVVYHAQLQFESAVKNYWNLKAIDSIQDLHKMNKEERVKIIKSLVTDKLIQDILEARVDYFESER